MDEVKLNDGESFRILVTGADGMLGNNIVRELVSRNHRVSCFIEQSHDGKVLENLPVKIYKGDLLDESVLIPVFNECDYVIHTAGVTAMWPARSELSWRVNVEAVQLLVKLSKKYQIKRFVHIGTATSFGHGSKQNPGTEKLPYSNYKFKLDYQDTKFQAQEYLLKEYKEHDFPVIILNPTFMLGKYDNGNGSNKMVLFISKGRVPGYSPGGKNYVHVRDVAVAAANALTKGRNGECYITGHKNLSYGEAFTLIAKTMGAEPPKIPLPRFASLGFGALQSARAFFTGKTPAVSYRMAKIGCEDCYYSSRKAVEELQMPQTPVEDGILESYEYFKEKGFV